MLLKAGVDISRLNPGIRQALTIISDLFSTSKAELVITSTYEGTHAPSSLHYSNDAFDFLYVVLFNDFSEEALLDSLGNSFIVVFGSDYIHVEYNP